MARPYKSRTGPTKRLSRSITFAMTEPEFQALIAYENQHYGGTNHTQLLIDTLGEKTGIKFRDRKAANQYTKNHDQTTP